MIEMPSIRDAAGMFFRMGISILAVVSAAHASAAPDSRDIRLRDVRTFAYLIQQVDGGPQQSELRQSHYDMYVLEPVVTEKGRADFDISGLIRDIRDFNRASYRKNPIILAYADVGQAEDWRWYWRKGWHPGQPDWIVRTDPGGWEGNYPVAYWHPAWQDIVIYGSGGMSHVEAALRAGFDGIYMDWVEAFSDPIVRSKADKDGISDPAEAMFDFIEKIRSHARSGSGSARPGFLIVAQNAPDLYVANPARYETLIDAISCEAIWYDGTGGFDEWGDPAGYNIPTDTIYPGWTGELLGYLGMMGGRIPIFCVEYAQDLGGLRKASEVYETLAPAYGFVAYCTRRLLGELSHTPYPPLYLQEKEFKTKKTTIRR